MTDENRYGFDYDTGSHPEGMSGRRILAMGVGAIVILAGLIWIATRDKKETPDVPEPRRVETVPEGTRNVTLYFAAADEPGIQAEARELAVGRRMDEQVRQVVDALIAGPSGDRSISAIPAGTQLLSVMVDADSGTVYLDFSSELVAAHPGGSAAEYCTVASIVRTVGENFPELQSVQLLVDGSQVESIAGHVRADQPLYIREWR